VNGTDFEKNDTRRTTALSIIFGERIMFKLISAISPRSTVLGLAGLTLASSLMISCTSTTDSVADGCTTGDSLTVCRELLVETGTTLFAQNCSGCHGQAGNGQGHGAPPIANADYAMGTHERLVVTLLHGVRAPITVNGKSYPGGSMQAWEETFTNKEIAGLTTYIRSVLNDSLVSNCVASPTDAEVITCTKTARNPADVLKDTVPVWFVKAVRDTLSPLPAL